MQSLHVTAYYKILCSLHLDEAVLEEGAGLSDLYLEGARWYEEQGRLVQIFTEYYEILCSVLSDEAVPEEGAGISGL